MSYDLYLVRPGSTDDALVFARTMWESEEDEAGRGTSAQEQEKNRLASILLATFPGLQAVDSTMTEVPGSADGEIEIHGPKDTGITIYLYNETAAVTISYGKLGADDTAVLDELGRYLQVLQREGLYAIYDPQEDRILDPNEDLTSIQRLASAIHAKLPPHLGADENA